MISVWVGAWGGCDFRRVVGDVHHRLRDFIHAVVFTVVMRRSGGGGIGFGRTLRCILVSGSGPNWFLLLLFSSVCLILRLVVLGCLLIQLGLTRNSARPGFPTFAALGKGEASLEEFDEEVEEWLPLLPEVSLPCLTGQYLQMLSIVRVLLLAVLKAGVGGS